MNYGYSSLGKRRDQVLARRLEREVLPALGLDAYGMAAYVEVDGLYPGVRIRRLTHYDDAKIERLRQAADAVFDEVAQSTKGGAA